MKTNELIAILQDEDEPNVLDYIQEAADTLQLQKVRIMELETELKRVKAERRWIPVTERLPESGVRVIVCRGNKVEQGVFLGVNGWWKVYGTNTKNVTHWMPLPEPPKEG